MVVPLRGLGPAAAIAQPRKREAAVPASARGRGIRPSSGRSRFFYLTRKNYFYYNPVTRSKAKAPTSLALKKL